MKNFKKVLALVLVLATLMGFATVAGAAYKDEKDINADYSEAVQVLDLIATMQGYPDGEFKPTNNITREEAAKLIAIFDNRDAKISDYYTSINPFADEKGRWGESYVGYGYRAGIIAGMNATTYAPTANVTGTQFLKMALVTLGYDQEAEGFVGSSWAVNVLALARKIKLIDGLEDGWKPENALTREQAAQILLNTLNAEMVEYAQEAKSVDFAPKNVKDNDGNYTFTWKGRIYLTVAGAVSTGKPLYEKFKLDTETSTDAFYRPYTRWILDKDSDDAVEVMKAPKATFTTTFNTCELLVALGVKESDTKTTVTIEKYYLNGEDMGYNNQELHHTTSKCDLKDSTKGVYHEFGAQGTLTQVFKMKNADGDTVYRICSIDTWLAKVTKVDKTTTSRDNHKKGTDSVEMVAYMKDQRTGDYAGYNNAAYNDASTVCKNLIEDNKNDKGDVVVTFDDPEGLAKDDYVLFTYSVRNNSEQGKYYKTTFTPGVQTVDVTEGKEGRLNGYKTSSLAVDPSETRIDGEYITDAVHFHLGFNDSKNEKKFGTHTFFYDAYGNVIGMKDGADTSKYGVLDKAYIEFSEGVATLYADIVNLDATITKKAVVTNFTLNGNDFADTKYGRFDTLADFVSSVIEGQHVTNGENFHDFDTFYDKLGKMTVNSKEEYSLSRKDGQYSNGTAHATVVKGKPIVKVGDTQLKTNNDTQYLIRIGDIGDGKYVAYTGYKNVKSVKSDCFDIVMDSNGEYAEVVYLYKNVAFTDGTVVAYVPDDADLWKEEVEDDGTVYYLLTVYVNGTEETFRLGPAAANAVKGNAGKFYKFQYVDIDEVTTVSVVGSTGFKLATKNKVWAYKDGVLNTWNIIDDGEAMMGLADDCAVYSIRKDGTVVKEELTYLDGLDKGDEIYLDWNDKNDDDVNKIVAIYVIEADED